MTITAGGSAIVSMEWKIYYYDGNTFDSTMGIPPIDGVICIVQKDFLNSSNPHHVGREIVSKHDFYWYKEFPDIPARWDGGDLAGLIFQYMHNLDQMKLVRVGHGLPFEYWREIYEKAQNDPDFPRMSGKRNE